MRHVYRAVWTSHPDGRFYLQIADDSMVTRYRFATETADFHICLTCGVIPVVTCMIEGTQYVAASTGFIRQPQFLVAFTVGN